MSSGVSGAAGSGGDDLVACRSKGQVKALKGGWLQIKPFRPDSGEGEARIDDFTHTPTAPNRIFATNGVVVKLSADGGCTWNPIAEGSPIQLPQEHDTDIFTALAASSDDRLWVAGYDDVAGVARPRLHLYDNVGPSAAGDPVHTQPENGLPAVGKPVELLASTFDPDELYMIIDEPADPERGRPEPTRRLWATFVPENPPQASLVGRTWKHVPTPEELGSLDGIAMGATPGTLWAWSGNKAVVSTDANADDPNWSDTVTADGKITAIDVNIANEALIASESAQGAVGRMASSAGKLIGGRRALPAVPTSMTHGQLRPETRVLSGKAGTYGFDAAQRKWLNITPPGKPELRNLMMANGRAARIVLGHTKDAFYRFDTYSGESFVRRPVSHPEIDFDLLFSEYDNPHFASQVVNIRVEPGKSKDVTDELRVPATINKLDVFFLVDTTGSMQPTIEGLKQDIYLIADQLKKKVGQQACFGVGDFKDDAATDYLSTYRRHMKITCETDPVMPQIRTALSRLHSAGGGADPPEAHTLALKQMMTGEGSTDPLVLPDQDAEFRRDAYKVVVLITDAPFKQRRNYPSIEDVASTLRASDVRVVSVLVRTNLDPAPAYVDMAALAQGTDSLAPPGGVDCDNDGKIGPPDARQGDPIVCQSDGSNPNIGPLIVTLLLGVEDPGTVTVGVDDPHGVVGEPVAGTLSAIMNLKRDVRMPFTLPATCTPAQDGMDLPVNLTASVRAVPIDAAAQIIVKCRSVPIIEKRIVPPPRVIEPPEVVRPVPRPPVALAVVPPANPPAPVSNINLNAGFSKQEEQQYQLAAVTQGASEESQDEEIELAMSGLGQDTSATPVAAFLAGAAVLSAATAVAHRRRLQRSTRPGYARVS